MFILTIPICSLEANVVNSKSHQYLNPGCVPGIVLNALDVTSLDTDCSPEVSFHLSFYRQGDFKAQMVEITSTPKCTLPNKVNVKAI